MSIKQALIMAAGEAKRMRPLTNNLPKPLVELSGEPLLTHIINHLRVEGVTTIIINGYHAIAPLKNYINDLPTQYPDIEFILSEEKELLETGGGAVQALHYINPNEPFYMINGDAFWVNPPTTTTLGELAKAYTMLGSKLTLLLQSIESMSLTGSVGDYNLDGNTAARAHQKDGNHMFTGVRVCHPDILKGYNPVYFSFLTIMDAIEAAGHLHGLSHRGEWYHISTPQDVADVENYLAKRITA